MTQIGKKYILLIIVFSGVAFLLFFKIYKFFERFDPKQEIQLVEFSKSGDNVYIVAKAWGIGANHNEIYISQFEPCLEVKNCIPNKCLLLYATELYYRTNSVDTLEIFVAYSAVVTDEMVYKLKNISIVINRLNSYDEIMEMKKNHTHLGLKRASVYEIQTSTPILPKVSN